MGFYNPITYFIKSFIRLFTRKFFWVILILICVFLGFIIFSSEKVLAVDNIGVFGNYYGNFLGGMNITIDDVDLLIQAHKGNYDSFIIRQWGNSSNWYLRGIFYNYSYSGKAYQMYFNNNTHVLSTQNYGTPLNSSDCSHWFTITNDGVFTFDNSIDSIGGYHEFGVVDLSDRGFYTNRPIYQSSTQLNNVLYGNIDTTIQDLSPTVIPYFITTDEELETFDFDYLQINGGTTLNSYYFEPLDVVYNADYLLQYRYKGVVTDIDVRPYLTVNNDQTWQINIPYNVLTNYVVVRNGEDFSYRFRYTLQYQTGYDMLKEGIYDLSSQQQQDINEDSYKYVQGEILDQQKETNQKLDDLNNSITNDDVDDVSSEFGDFANDFGAEDNTGIEQIFQKLYDAFCSDEIQDVVITIPFVNKTFTISTDTISSNFPQAIKSIVGVFVWGVIGLWVLKDIRSSINKIAEGSPEDVGSDVKKEVL